MKIFVKVRPGAKRAEAKRIDSVNLMVAVREPAREGKANGAVIKMLADYFKVSVSRVRIVKGRSRRQKIVEII